MSVSFNPNVRSTPQSAPREKGFFERWIVDPTVEGYKMERMPCSRYCDKKWGEAARTQEVYAKCIKECEFVKTSRFI